MAGLQVPVDFEGNFDGLMDGFSRDLNGRLRDAKGRFVSESAAMGKSAGASLNKSFLGSFGSRFAGDARRVAQGFTRVLGGTLQAGAAVVGGAVATTLGAALTGGLGRLTAIDNAEAKLLGLGNSAEDVSKIMDNALNAVKGTAFGLGDAATAAASVVAAGVKPGQELERTLRLIGSTASVAGAEYGEIASIFNKVAASGRIQGEELAQLGDRGIPILNMLSDSLGVTVDEVREMASAGEISFEDFQKALDPLGPAAKIAGTSVSASFANVRASLGRIGANLLKPIFDQLGGAEGVFARLITAMEPIEGAASRIGESLGGAFTAAIDTISGLAEKIAPVWNALGGGGQTAVVIGGIAGSLVALGQALGPLLGPFAQLIPSLGSLRGAFSILTGPVGLVIGLLTAAFTYSEPFRQSLQDLGATLMEVGGQMATGLGPTISTLLPTLQNAFRMVGEVVGGLLAQILPLVGVLISELAPVFMQVVAAIGPLIDAIGLGLQPVITGLMVAMQVIVPVVQTVFQTVAGVISGAVSIITGVVNVVVGLLTGDWDRAFQGAKSIVQGVFKIITSVISSGYNLIRNIFTKITGKELPSFGDAFRMIKDAVVRVWNQMIGTLGSALSRLVSNIRAGWQLIRNTVVQTAANIYGAVRNTFNRIVSTISSVMARVVSAIRGGWNRAVSAVSSAVARVVGAVRGIRSGIINAVSGFGSMLYNAGRNIIQGLINGIRNMAGSVKNAVSGVMQSARDLLPFSPAKEGPFSGRGWSLYSGEAIMSGLAEGLKRAGPLAVKASTNVLTDVADPVRRIEMKSASAVRSSPVAGPVSNSYSSAPVVNQNYYGPTTGSERKQELEWTLRYATGARTFETAGIGVQ